ncbi:hypothetical protein [Paenibacillus sp. SI8]
MAKNKSNNKQTQQDVEFASETAVPNKQQQANNQNQQNQQNQ